MSDEIIITITIRGGSVTVGGAASGAGQAAEVSGPTPQPLDQLRALGAAGPLPTPAEQLPQATKPSRAKRGPDKGA